jgi:hypothetical protein
MHAQRSAPLSKIIMQVGPTMLSMSEEVSIADKKEYAAVPLAFVRMYLSSNGRDSTERFLHQVRLYPFISDLFGEYLHRGGEISASANFLTMVTREVIGDMTLSELCLMMQQPLSLLAESDGLVAPSDVATIFRELHLSTIASQIEQHPHRLRPQDLEQILSPSAVVSAEPAAATEAVAEPSSVSVTEKSNSVTETSPVTASSSVTASGSAGQDYSQFLSELKDAGVIIPPSSKEPKVRGKSRRNTRADETTDAPSRTSRSKASEPRAPLRGVESMLSPHAREKIMSKIFRDDENDFRRSMELINNAKDWKQASIYLDALFMRRKVDPDSKTATRLTDAVYARFHLVG